MLDPRPSIMHSTPFAVGLNCALGAAQMRPFIERIQSVCPVYTICYPNAVRCALSESVG